jgi:hypothetical protein
MVQCWIANPLVSYLLCKYDEIKVKYPPPNNFTYLLISLTATKNFLKALYLLLQNHINSSKYPKINVPQLVCNAS